MQWEKMENGGQWKGLAQQWLLLNYLSSVLAASYKSNKQTAISLEFWLLIVTLN